MRSYDDYLSGRIATVPEALVPQIGYGTPQAAPMQPARSFNAGFPNQNAHPNQNPYGAYPMMIDRRVRPRFPGRFPSSPYTNPRRKPRPGYGGYPGFAPEPPPGMVY